MKKEAYYFSHDSNAKDDPKILQLRMEMGWEGYGLFWALIEMLRNESDHRMKKHYKSIAFALHTQEDSIKRLINDFDLFAIDDQNFWSESLLKRMEMKEAKSEKMREAANKRWNKDDDAKAMHKHSISNAEAMQLKERKGKETKENILTEESHNEIFRKLWNSTIWLEGIAIKNKATKDQVRNHLNEFRQECILKDELKVNEKDAKNHFINWMKRGNPILEKEDNSPKYPKSTIEDNWW
jgi:membrane-associated HD superfamily phosphohydrolase